jgi:hypothetical protein
MTVSRLRCELSEDEFISFAAYYSLKNEREKQEASRIRSQA